MIHEYISANWNSWKITLERGVKIFFYASGAIFIDMTLAWLRGPHATHQNIWAAIGPGAVALIRAAEGYWRYHGDLPPVVKVDKAA